MIEEEYKFGLKLKEAGLPQPVFGLFFLENPEIKRGYYIAGSIKDDEVYIPSVEELSIIFNRTIWQKK